MARSSTRSTTVSSQMAASPTPNGVYGDENAVDGGPRRSGRTRKRPANYNDDDDEKEFSQNLPTPSPGKKIKILQRRNPQRAVAAPRPSFPVPDEGEIQERAFAPLEPQDLRDWRGWTDVESEPSFFNFILHELGVKDAKVQEVFSVDESAFGYLPKPIYGLIFLYQFRDEYDPDREDCPSTVWFANQTTVNACATIAILNIAMNCQDLHLGDNLDKFRAETQPLSPALRGHLLSNNDVIRTAHNSFARRIDILNSDLGLKNEADEYPKKKKKTTTRKVSQKTKKADKDAAFHYIAYVPIGDQVWELDGMHSQPLCLGSFSGDWASAALSRIQHRMFAYEQVDDNGAFNLLAFCHSPFEDLRNELASNIRHLLMLDQNQAASNNEWAILTGDKRAWMDDSNEADLEDYKLTKDDIYKVVVPQSFVDKISKPSFGTSEAMDLLQSLQDEQQRICSQYTTEAENRRDDMTRVAGRKRDYTPALHLWVKKLAEQGLLKELQQDID